MGQMSIRKDLKDEKTAEETLRGARHYIKFSELEQLPVYILCWWCWTLHRIQVNSNNCLHFISSVIRFILFLVCCNTINLYTDAELLCMNSGGYVRWGLCPVGVLS